MISKTNLIYLPYFTPQIVTQKIFLSLYLDYKYVSSSRLYSFINIFIGNLVSDCGVQLQ